MKHTRLKVYLAAPYALRDHLRERAGQLQLMGHECTSSWLKETHALTPSTLGTSPASSDEYATFHVAQDIWDVQRSDALVLHTWSYSGGLIDGELGPNSGGRHVETGVAMALGIPVIVLGEPENIFHRGTGVIVANSWAAAKAAINRLAPLPAPTRPRTPSFSRAG